MADHIKINTAELRGIGDTLGRLMDEFGNSGKIVDHYSGFLGSGRMADTLHEFATNWDIHKGKLLANMARLQKAAANGADAWDGLDKDLADALTKGDDKGKDQSS